MIDPVFQHALFMIKDDKWKRCRSIMTPTFTVGKLRLMKSILNDTAATYIHNFENCLMENGKTEVELKNVCGAYTMDSIVQIAFGVKVDSLVDGNHPLIKHAKSIFQQDLGFYNLLVVVLTVLAPWVVKLFGMRMNGAALHYMGELAKGIIQKKKEDMKDANNNNPESSKANNFIELLLEAENERIKLETNELQDQPGKNKEKAIKFMTDDEIVAQCVLFFIVGYDTTATTITLTLYHLALNPQFQERLYDEIMSNLKDAELENEDEKDPVKLFSFERVQKMKLLEAVIKETLRLYPPATFTERQASEDVTLENGSESVYIKKDDVVNIPIYSIHSDERFWNDPETFNPDRFIDGSYHKYAYLPFGAGPRDCIAKGLAYLEAKIAVLHAVRMFKLSKSPKTPIPVQFYYQSNLLINKDVFVNMEKRN